MASSMKSPSTICRRCHRLRAVDNTRACASCFADLRAMERRRPAPIVNIDAESLIEMEDVERQLACGG